jgi:hypothetical protein
VGLNVGLKIGSRSLYNKINYLIDKLAEAVAAI